MRKRVKVAETEGWVFNYHLMGTPGDPLGQGGILTFNRVPVVRVSDDGSIEILEENLKNA